MVSDFAKGIAPSEMPVGPSSAHWLGTDRLFRDQLSRLAEGAQLSLLIGVSATLIASTIGATVGIVAGYFEGSRGLRIPWPAIALAGCGAFFLLRGQARLAAMLLAVAAIVGIAIVVIAPRGLSRGPSLTLDTALMRLIDVLLSLPFLLLVMAIGAAVERTDVATLLLTLGLTGWLQTARVLRAKTMHVRTQDFVGAARALGQSTPRILLSHILPNVAGPLIVTATTSVAHMILAESVLSYLGVGISPPAATWGRMLFEGQDFYQAAPWLLAGPAIAIVVAVFGFNLLGEGLRDALDPRPS